MLEPSEKIIHFSEPSVKSSREQILYQSPPTPGDAKGKITFGPNGVDITLLAKADRTTFLHETGHFFFKVLSDLSAPENAPERLKGEFQCVFRGKSAGDSDRNRPPITIQIGHLIR